jgi:hypothetical protein
MSPWLAAAYAALALGLAWTLTSGPSWRRRAPYIVCAPALAFALWLDRPNPAGWPSKAKTPSEANLLWALVDEPNQATADPGRIFLWLDVGSNAPRAYSLPYSRPLEKRVQQALHAIKLRRPVEVTRANTRPTRRRGTGSVTRHGDLQFRPGQSAVLPAKAEGQAAP